MTSELTAANIALNRTRFRLSIEDPARLFRRRLNILDRSRIGACSFPGAIAPKPQWSRPRHTDATSLRRSCSGVPLDRTCHQAEPCFPGSLLTGWTPLNTLRPERAAPTGSGAGAAFRAERPLRCLLGRKHLDRCRWGGMRSLGSAGRSAPTLRCRFVRGPLRPPHGGQQFLKVAAQYDPPNFVSLSMERPSLPRQKNGKT